MAASFQVLKNFQHVQTPLILKELEHFFDYQVLRAEHKDKVLVEMVKVLKEFTLRGGKRIRPLLVILGYQLANGSEKKGNLYRAAAAAEVHHHYLLNLDDMADRDVLRHGGKTLEEYYRSEFFQGWPDKNHHGQTFSSISGALLNSYTFELLATSNFAADRILEAEKVVTDMLFSDTLVGWQLQYFQNNQPVQEASEEVFLKGLEYVTSRYSFIGPLWIGLSLAIESFSPEWQKLSAIFVHYGKHVGIAFQIQDDILGVFGDPKETGKAVGNDVREGKKTLLIQYAYQHGNAAQKKVIESALNKPLLQTELDEVQQVMKDTGSLAYSQQLAEKHVAEAVNALKELPQELNEVQVLKELAEYMIKRAK